MQAIRDDTDMTTRLGIFRLDETLDLFEAGFQASIIHMHLLSRLRGHSS